MRIDRGHVPHQRALRCRLPDGELGLTEGRSTDTGRHRDHHPGGGGERPIAHRIPEPGLPGEGGIGGELDSTVTQHRGGATERCVDSDDTQGVSVDVEIVGEDIHRHGDVFGRGGLVVDRHRGIVDRPHGHGHETDRGALAIADGVGELESAVAVRIGHEPETLTHPGDGGTFGLGVGDDRENVAVDVYVVGEHVDDDVTVLVDGHRVGHGDHRVVHRKDSDGHGSGGGALAVADGVGDALGAVEVEARRVADRHRPQHHRRPAPVGGGSGDEQGVAVDVVVVASDVDDRGCVLGDGDEVRNRHGGVVDGGHGDSDRGRIGELTVGDGVRERIGAVPVRIRGVGDGAVTVVNGNTVGRLGHRLDRQGVTFHIGVVRQHRHRRRRVLIDGGRII